MNLYRLKFINVRNRETYINLIYNVKLLKLEALLNLTISLISTNKLKVYIFIKIYARYYLIEIRLKRKKTRLNEIYVLIYLTISFY